jgi:hypothetical protein
MLPKEGHVSWVKIGMSMGGLLLLVLFSGYSKSGLSATNGKGYQLQQHQGRYFRVAVPNGWQVRENASAVEVGAPDGKTGYSFVLLMGGFGRMTPQAFLNMQLQNGPYQNPRILNLTALPNQPGPMGIPWQVIEADLRFGYQGTQVDAHAVCAVIQGAGQYSAVLRAYQAPTGNWKSVRGLLAAVDESLRITNPYQVAGVDKIQLPKGTSHDEIYGSYNQGYNQRQAQSADRLSKQQHEATMGYERMKDPNTGRFYDMPMSRYDPSVGGYRNPNDPTQLLVPAAPGE